MSLGGILGALAAGGGKAINENADDVIEERKRQAEMAEVNSTWEARYDKQRADQVIDKEDEQAFRIALAKENAKKGSGTRLAKLVSDFDANASEIVKQIDKINSDSMADRDQKLAALQPLYARLDDYMANNKFLVQESTLGGVLVNIRNQGFALFNIDGNGNPIAKKNTDTSRTAFETPSRANNTPTGALSRDGTDEGLLGRIASPRPQHVSSRTGSSDYTGRNLSQFN